MYRLFVALIGLAAAVFSVAARAQVISTVEVPAIPAGLDPFALTLEQTRTYSAARNFEVVGHTYLRVPERTAFARGEGREGGEIGSGVSSVIAYDGVAYVAGYSYPPTLYGTLTVDVSNPERMRPLAFIPCNPGTRCPYIRVDRKRKILIMGHDPDPGNPTRASGGTARTGWSFHDVSDPRRPRLLSFVELPRGATTHGLETDGRYLYGCAGIRENMAREAMQIIDYADPRKPRVVSTWHVQGMLPGETRGPLDGPINGEEQILQCHEIVYHDDRLYTSWRDAGHIIFDIRDRAKPRPIMTYDYVPPFRGGFLGAAHTALPVVSRRNRTPSLVVTVDEIFDCPTGFARVIDVSDTFSPDVVKGERTAAHDVLSTIRAPAHDDYDRAGGRFNCEMPMTGVLGGRSHSVHLPMMDHRSSGLLYLTWYAQGLRAIDISNPYAPREIGHYLSPEYIGPGGYEIAPGLIAKARSGRQTREVFQDPDTELIYVTDGNGGGLTVLRYTGPLPAEPLPGAR